MNFFYVCYEPRGKERSYVGISKNISTGSAQDIISSARGGRKFRTLDRHRRITARARSKAFPPPRRFIAKL